MIQNIFSQRATNFQILQTRHDCMPPHNDQYTSCTH